MARITPLLLLLLAFAAEAQTPDPIQGCINPRGRLRVVTDTGLCRDTETGITWPSTTKKLQPSRFQLVGFSTATFDGDEGILGFTLRCQSEFDSTFPGSRWCSSEEVIETTDVPSGLTGSAWVRPAFAHAGGGNPIDLSGLMNNGDALTCRRWGSASLQDKGLSMNSVGSFTGGTCSTPIAVACCALVP